MMPDLARPILDHLALVERLRSCRSADSELDRRVLAVKRFQHARFERTYADLLAAGEEREAARFFLDDLYGPQDFSDRDAQFSRIVPALVRLFPREIVETVASLAELHALSEQLDVDMARRLESVVVNAEAYAHAWQVTGQAGAREHQVELMMTIGRALVRYTRSALLRHSLRMMRGPARAAGLAALQVFLERGFETFGRLRRPEPFLDVIAARERRLCDVLFSGDAAAIRIALGDPA